MSKNKQNIISVKGHLKNKIKYIALINDNEIFVFMRLNACIFILELNLKE